MYNNLNRDTLAKPIRTNNESAKKSNNKSNFTERKRPYWCIYSAD